MKNMIIAAAVAAAVLLCGIVWLSAYTVSAKETVIVTQFGKIVQTRQEPGLYWKLPGGIHKVNRFDNRLSLFETQVIQLLLADKNPLIMRCYVAWRIADPTVFFQSLGRMDNATSKLNDMIVSDLGGILAEYRIDNIINTDAGQIKLKEIEDRLSSAANRRAKSKYGIELVQIGIRRIAYPDLVADAVYNRMASERTKEAAKLRAEGEQEAAKIESDADRQASEILAAAQSQAEITKGTGDSEAMRIYAEGYGTDPEFFDFMKSLEAYERVLGNKSTLVLSTDSDLFKYLNPGGDRKSNQGPRE